MGTTIQIGHSVRLRSDKQVYEIQDIDLEAKSITATLRGVRVRVPFADIYEIVPRCGRNRERVCAEG